MRTHEKERERERKSERERESESESEIPPGGRNLRQTYSLLIIC